ncbi:hypothetical protein QCA50_000540 [Cerrena zonata]|uniref:VTT domain-containing protein n=1 Tax=Cerrena zonata TaxID=2478898 RepID=A0AAW0GQX6_9APHY
MASLAPPVSRHRASSTNVRPPLTLSSLGRRRSNSLLDLSSPLPSPSHTPPRVQTPIPDRNANLLTLSIPAPISKSASDSMLSVLLARCLELFHVSHGDASVPSSPRLSRTSTSSDDTLLPISSPITATFGDIVNEKPSSAQSRRQGSSSVHAPVLIVIILFPLSAALVLFCMSTLPITVSWPKNLTDLAQLGRELHGYSQSGALPMAHVIAVMSVTAVWKHAWSIPGSVIWNVLAGALFSPAYATLLLTTLTTIGSIFATLLAAPLAPFLSNAFPRALAMTRDALEGSSSSNANSSSSKSSPWVRLSILRLIGVIPWSGINIACGVCGVSIIDCFKGTFIGSLPWTAVTCQIGDILQSVTSNPSPTPKSVQSLLASPEIITKLVFLTFLSLAPILGRNHLRNWISASVDEGAPISQTGSDKAARWGWVKEWRAKIHIPSRSVTRESSQQQLETLIREKNSLPL